MNARCGTYRQEAALDAALVFDARCRWREASPPYSLDPTLPDGPTITPLQSSSVPQSGARSADNVCSASQRTRPVSANVRGEDVQDENDPYTRSLYSIPDGRCGWAGVSVSAGFAGSSDGR